MTKNKLKPSLLLGTALLAGTVSYAQNIAPQSVNNGGAKVSQANGSLSFIIGETAVLKQTDTQGNTLNSGFSAGATLTTVSVLKTDTALLDVNVFPNPTSELINIQINHSGIRQLLVTITDAQGKEVYNGEYAAISNTIGINTRAYARGIYMLSLKNASNQLLGNYKIIKN